MEKMNLFLMDMSEEETISGVTRYLETLIRGLITYSDINVCWIRLIHSTNILFHTKVEKQQYTEYIIPLPLSMDEIINESFWNQKYNEIVYHIIQPLFEGKERILIHTHTLNLIDLALYIKSHLPCKVITHLHCIPWKGIYNRNLEHFNHLYELAYIHSTPETSWQLVMNDWEFRSYTKADRLICVTQCGADFVRKGVSGKLPPIDVIPNGLDDFYEKTSSKRKKGELIQLIYVGTISPSKGLSFILEALRGVKRRGYNVQLKIAGKGHPRFVNPLLSSYRDLNLKLLGLLPFEQLKKHYQESDIGVIASLQEQASYVAIEMAMFGLPVITTAIDGLDETFTNDVDALKIEIFYSKIKGLTVDVEMFEDRIVELIENKKKRMQLRHNVR